jgi:hypothetical protein
MRVFFETADGIQLYVSESNGQIIACHSTNPPAILAALREDAAGADPIARVLAEGTLKLINLVGINVIE